MFLLCYWLLAIAVVGISYGSKISKEACLNNATLHGHCYCEVISSDVIVLARLSCSGNGAVKAAKNVLQMTEDLLFVELNISSSKSHSLQYSNLKGVSRIKKITLSKNALTDTESLFLNNFQNLEILCLSDNKIGTIKSGTFEFLTNLQNLSMGNNQIDLIDPDAFQPLKELRHLDLSNNNLSAVDPKWFSTLENLVSLNLADNEISVVMQDSFRFLSSLQYLDLSGNKLEELHQQVFYPLKKLRQLSLSMNKLRMLSETIFKLNKQLEQVNLTGNLWVCNRQLLLMQDWLKANEVDKSLCFEPPEFSDLTLQNGLHILYLEVKLEESPICNTSMCNCTVSKEKQVVTVDCIGRGFTKLPESLPYKSRVLDLRSNHIKSLMMDHVNATQWSDISFLHLNNNLIDSLKGLEGTWLLRNLVALHLTNNQLTEIPIHILEQFRGGLLDELYLSGNPWNCDCNTVRFQTWLQDNYKIIKDFDGIRCSSESGIYSNQPIYRLLKSQLCPQDIELINYLDVLNGLMAVAILLIIMKLSFDFWLQKRTGKLPRFFSLNMS